jgi:hypothetical protein
MPLSLSSYLLGVGTVVGALSLGFGGGVVLTHTAMKQSPVGQTRIEQFARPESQPAAAPQTADNAVTIPPPNAAPAVASAGENAKPATAQVSPANSGPAQIAQAPAAQPAATPPAPADAPKAARAETPKPETQKLAEREKAEKVTAPAQPAATPAVQAETPKPEAQKKAEREQAAAPAQPAEPAKRSDQARQTDQVKPAASREAEQRRTAERKSERQQRYAERKSREMNRDTARDATVARTNPRQFEVLDEPEQEVVSEPQEQPRERHFDLFRMPGLFDRPDRPDDGDE